KNKKIYTPPLADGCVDGTMRKWVISELDVINKSILLDEMLDADEVFVTNAINGVISVKTIERTAFTLFNTANCIQKKLINLSLGF
ncbi:MAG: aminotransferase class IV, partial [Bacteroidota bacterium]|nr:aminotransferase class IV [Bacteroidota bacterium]